MKKIIVVTGGAGFVGSNLIEYLLSKTKFKIKFDKTKPNGTPRKVLDVSLATNYGWKSKTKLEEAIQLTYKNFKLNR